MNDQQVHVIINPAAGGDEAILNTLNKAWHPLAIDWRVAVTRQAGDGTHLARAALDAGADVVALYGGDGTLMDVANGMIGSETPLMILPGGTGNAMATELGIPLNLSDAAGLLASDPIAKPIDLGRAGDRYFVLRAAIGMHARVAESATREMKARFGNMAYIISTLQHFGQMDPTSYRLVIDGEAIEAEGVTCLIASSVMIGRLNIALSASVDPGDGLLDVFILDDSFQSTVSMVGSMLNLETWTEPLQHWQGREIRVDAEPPQLVRLDGESYGETPLTVTVVPGAVKILVPRSGVAAAL